MLEIDEAEKGEFLNTDRSDVKKSNFIQASINGLNVLAGYGILSLPFAFQQSGWILGLFFLVYYCLFTNYTAKLLGYCQNSKPNLITLPDIAEYSHGYRMKKLVTLLLTLELLFASALFISIMADHLFILFPFYSRNKWATLSTIVIFPTTLTDKLHILSYFSFVGIVTTIFILLVLIQTAFFPEDGQTKDIYSIDKSSIETVGSVPGIGYSLGIHMVGYAGHAQFPMIYESMENKELYNSMLNLIYVLTFLFYLLFGVIGYFMFLPDIDEEITLSLFKVSKTSIFVKLVTYSIILNPISKYSISLNSMSSVYEENGIRYGLRTGIVLTTLLINIYLPSFAFLCALIGSVCSYLISGILPMVFYLKLFKGKIKFEAYFIYILLFINTPLWLISVVYTLKESY